MLFISRIAVACVSLIAISTVQAEDPQKQSSDATWGIPSDDAIHALLAGRMKHNGVGIVVGVIDAGKRRVIAYGRSGATDGRPLDGDTVFQIGSVTKVFTGLLLADMVLRDEVDIDDPASKYLPPNVRMPERGRPITLIDLSKHWSALPSMPTNFDLGAKPNPYAAYSVGQLYHFLSTYELRREPGTQEYSNLGVALLGRLLARRADSEYEPLLTRRVLEPLGLTSTSITLSADQLRRLAPGHDRFLEPVETWEMRTLPASGSLRSTANDLLTFLACNLGERASPLNHAMVYQRTPMRSLGWGRAKLGGEEVYGHDGGKEGYRSAIIFNPERKTGVVVLMNARTADRPLDLAKHLLFSASALPPATVAPTRPRIAALDAAILERYAGRYRLEAGSELRVARSGNRLLIETVGGGVAPFFPSAEREFFSNQDDERLVFEGDDDHVTGLVLHEGQRTRRAPKINEVR